MSPVRLYLVQVPESRANFRDDRSAPFQPRTMTRTPDWTELRSTRTIPTLLLAADYSQGGVDSSVSAYAIAVSTRREGEKLVERAIERTLAKHLPNVNETPEIHMKQIWSGQQRQKTAFHQLSFEEVRAFLRDLARNFAKAVPFAAVSVQANQPSESRAYRGPKLYGGALQLVTELLAEKHLRVGSAPILIDRADPFQMIHYMRGEPRRFAPLSERLSDGDFFCNPSPVYVDSALSPLVQAADFCAFVVVRLIGELQKVLEHGEEKNIRDFDFFLELINLMRINIDIALPTDHLEYAPAPWEVRTVGPDLPALIEHIHEVGDGRLDLTASLHQAKRRMRDRVNIQRLLTWPRVSTCHSLTPLRLRG